MQGALEDPRLEAGRARRCHMTVSRCRGSDQGSWAAALSPLLLICGGGFKIACKLRVLAVLVLLVLVFAAACSARAQEGSLHSVGVSALQEPEPKLAACGLLRWQKVSPSLEEAGACGDLLQ